MLQQAYPNLSPNKIESFLHDWERGEEWGPDAANIFTYQPYSYHRNRDRTSRYVNVTNGFRKVPDQGPWPLDPTALNLFLFGGSTAFGYNVKEDETIAAHLSQIIHTSNKNIKFNIYNFGQAGYYSTQERILFERLLTQGNIPHIAIFLDGLNDFYHRDDVVFFYSKLFQEMFDKPYTTRLLDRLDLYYNPLKKIRRHLKNYKKYKQNPHSQNWGYSNYWENPKERQKKFNDRTILEKVLKTYLHNTAIAEAAGKSFGVKVGFFWQPIPHYNGDRKYLPFYRSLHERHLCSEFGYKLFRKKIDSNQVKLPKRFSWLADIQQRTDVFLYVDGAHYNAVFSKVIAQKIYEDLVSWEMLPSDNQVDSAEPVIEN